MRVDVEGLTVTLSHGTRPVDGISFSVESGQVVALVGETGSGKSVTARALLGLYPPDARVQGRLDFDEVSMIGASDAAWRRLRGSQVGLIFQEPRRALNPVFSVGRQVMEAVQAAGRNEDRAAIRARANALFQQVGLPDSDEVFKARPHQLSGGMGQRVGIALAIAQNPSLLVADEPTSALDVTLAQEIWTLFRNLVDGGMGLVLISHDLDEVSRLADRVVVVYAGRTVENASTRSLFEKPGHPYTEGLLAALPKLDGTGGVPMPGSVPSIDAMPSGCRFHPRCRHATECCRVENPPLVSFSSNRWLACHHPQMERTC